MSVSQTANTGVSQNTYPEKNLQSYRKKNVMKSFISLRL